MKLALDNSWSGGQYSLFRVALGTYWLGYFLLPWWHGVNPPAGTAVVRVACVVSALLLCVGVWDGVAAGALLGFVLLALIRGDGREALSLACLGWLSLAHLLLPRAPYGSWVARGRIDPAGSWRMSPRLFALGWVVLSLAYAYAGYGQLQAARRLDGSALVYAFELSFAPLALFRRARPWIWCGGLVLQLVTLARFGGVELSAGPLLLHLWTFDPGWILPRRAGETETIYYDGTCALCHGFVRFVLAEDRGGAAFRFAPLQGQTLPPGLPDSVIVRSGEGTLLSRSDAVLHVLARLGGFWRAFGAIGRGVPRPLRDAAYDAIARLRYRVFGRKTEACPVIPADLRSRFSI